MLLRPKLYFLLALSLLLFACSNAPKVPISERQFGDAKNNIRASDFKAALDNLNSAIKSTSDDAFRQQVLLLRTALVTALADSNAQMAEAYHVGSKQPAAQSQTGAFSRERSDYNNAARAYLMDGMQSMMNQRTILGAAPVPIEITFPGFTGGQDPALGKIKSGQFVPDSERMNAELQMDRNCLAHVLAGLAGDDQNLNKARDIFNAGKVDVDPRVYLVVLSDDFLRIGAMFDPHGINDPEKFRTVNLVVSGNLDAATKLLAAKPDKDLETRIKKMQAECDKCLKKAKA
jgi:hypothetical protein